MARGLSDLQKTILVMAYERLQKGEGTYQRSAEEIAKLKAFWGEHPGEIGGLDLPVNYLLRDHFGWSSRHPLDAVWCHKFSMKEVGEKEYRSVRASVSRSFRRLEERGLVERYRKGVILTDTGIELAKTLTVNS